MTAFRGIAPSVLLAQVRNTAPWAFGAYAGRSSDDDWGAVLDRGARVPHDPDSPEGRRAYFTLLLAAHFTTVATFVPTDVDSHLRYHVWRRVTDADDLYATVALLDRLDAWDARDVSARVVEVPGAGDVSGHDGEWFAVRAGALGRALSLGADDVTDALASRIHSELEREARAFELTYGVPGREVDALRLAATLAHNTGDLSRVIETWPVRTPASLDLARRFARLGHEDPARYDGLFHLAGHVNKAVTATENHRFLALRASRPLRTSRDLLLPLGPFFDAWGERVGNHPLLDDTARADVLSALLEGHAQDGAQQGYLRAIAGIHRTHPGGVDALGPDVPARLRKLLGGGPVRDALKTDAERFEARMVNRHRAALECYRAAR